MKASRRSKAPRRRHEVRMVVFAGLMLLSSSVATAAVTWQVAMGGDDLFHPDPLTIAVGDSVYWRNEDVENHTSTSGPPSCVPDGMWDSGDVLPGATWGRRFNSAGTFPYFCRHHCFFGMVGTINVQQPTGIEEKTWGRVKGLYR